MQDLKKGARIRELHSWGGRRSDADKMAVMADHKRRPWAPRQQIRRSIAPMLAVPADVLPSDSGKWAFEFKWDGVRAICFWDGKKLRLQSRNKLEITRRYPEVHGLGKALPFSGAVLDGEIIALDANCRPSFAQLQFRMHAEDAAKIATLSAKAGRDQGYGQDCGTHSPAGGRGRLLVPGFRVEAQAVRGRYRWKLGLAVTTVRFSIHATTGREHHGKYTPRAIGSSGSVRLR
jgi:hypothetical protein